MSYKDLFKSVANGSPLHLLLSVPGFPTPGLKTFPLPALSSALCACAINTKGSQSNSRHNLQPQKDQVRSVKTYSSWFLGRYRERGYLYQIRQRKKNHWLYSNAQNGQNPLYQCCLTAMTFSANELHWDVHVTLCSQLFRESHLFNDAKTGSHTALCEQHCFNVCHFLSKELLLSARKIGWSASRNCEVTVRYFYINYEIITIVLS